jgi:hypothetical protein
MEIGFILFLALISQETKTLKGRALLNPDISAIGNIVNQTLLENKIKNEFFIKEFEFAFQGYLYPSIRADIFLTAHGPKFGANHEHGVEGNHIGLDLEEAYVSLLNIWGGFSGKIGRKYIEFGKFNPLHAEQWLYVDPPKVIQNMFGTENLIGDGGQIEFLFPLPFLLRIQGGIFRNFEGPFQDVFYSSRAFSSFGISEFELSFGTSYVGGKTEKEFANFIGGDITLDYIKGYTKLTFILEPILAVNEKSKFAGFYSSLFYSTRRFQAGFRIDGAEPHKETEEEHTENKISFGISPIFAFLLTETTKIRFQYSFFPSEKPKHTIFFQLIFGLGPHSHVLQF